ncbi:hypothetical protein P43SY_009478 [Pythium insidiosum]|uniref:Palmitoyltransferase n=1 Tax=Pythium insidiosum TaxID=114742 RepID=A0AAD5Q7M4_PYTIN|nr:hypothetical protein P43SY_009478 [Pythium insidiosum]
MASARMDSREYAAPQSEHPSVSIALVVHDDADSDADELLLHDGELLTHNMDPFACLCCCRLKRLGYVEVLRDERVMRDGKLRRSLLLVGPHWIGVVITLCIILGSTALFLAQQGPHMKWYLVLLTLALCAMTLYYLFHVACKDPGIVAPPRRRLGEKASEEQRQAKAPSESKDLHVTDKGGEDDRETLAVDDDAVGEPAQAPAAAVRRTPRQRHEASTFVRAASRFERRRYCDVCDVEQPRDAEHCDDCGVCVDGYDHHCPWMGKCIGRNNMHAFKMFNVSWVLYVVFVLGVSIQNADWSDAAVEHLHRLSNGQWVRSNS